jgi:hypothetical protein
VEEVIIVVVMVEDRIIIIIILFYISRPEFQLELLYLSPLLRYPADLLIYPFALILPRNEPDFTERSNILITRNKNILAEIILSPIAQPPRSG